MATGVLLWLHGLGLRGNPPALLTASAKMMGKPWESNACHFTGEVLVSF